MNWIVAAGTLQLSLSITHSHAFTISPLPTQVTMFKPITVSWTRDNNDPANWFLRKQGLDGEINSNDFTQDTSEPLIVANPDAQSGEVTIAITLHPGTFGLLAFANSATRTPFFTSGPIMNAVRPAVVGSEIQKPAPTPLPTNQGSEPINSGTKLSTGFQQGSISTTTVTAPLPSESESFSSTNSSRHISLSGLIGGLFGGLILVIIMATWFICRRRRHIAKNNSRSSHLSIEPYTFPGSEAASHRSSNGIYPGNDGGDIEGHAQVVAPRHSIQRNISEKQARRARLASGAPMLHADSGWRDPVEAQNRSLVNAVDEEPRTNTGSELPPSYTLA